MWTIAIVGAFTALFAATIALRQFDLKKVFAYSTISQLGFMFVGVGVLAPVAGVFHLVTHAFFKALLFLSSGVVMHAMLGQLDMRKMSGLKTSAAEDALADADRLRGAGRVPVPVRVLLEGRDRRRRVGSADIILAIVMLFTAFLTAYYTFRLYFRVFEGPEVLPEGPADPQGHGHDEHLSDTAHDAAHDAHAHGEHNHEPMLMILPLVVLAIGALLAGWLNQNEHCHTSLARVPVSAWPPMCCRSSTTWRQPVRRSLRPASASKWNSACTPRKGLRSITGG